MISHLEASPNAHNYQNQPRSNAENWLEEAFPEAGMGYLAELREISEIAPHGVVFIKVGGEIVSSQLDDLVESVDRLTQLGIYPVIVHGAGPQIKAGFNSLESAWHPVTNDRITTDDTIAIIEQAAHEVNGTIVSALNDRYPGMAVGLNSGVVKAHSKGDEFGGRVGAIDKDGIAVDLIEQAAANKQVAVISFIGSDETGQTYNVNADDVSSAIAKKIVPHRYLAVTPMAVKRDLNKPEIIPVLDATNGVIWDLLNDGTIEGGMAKKVREGANLVNDPAMPDDFKVVILPASNDAILQELFTDEGAGTMILRGEEVVAQSLNEVLSRNLKRLLQKAFGKALIANYFQELPADTEVFHTKRGIRSAAIVLPRVLETGKHAIGPAYMDKLGSDREAAGKNVGKRVMKRVLSEHAEETGGVFWRARTANAALMRWYEENTSAKAVPVEGSEWTVFMQGVTPEDEAACLTYALAKAETFAQPA